MEYYELPQSHLLTNKVNVNLNMLHATIMNRIDSHVDCANIVAIDNGCRRDRYMKLLKQLAQPATMSKLGTPPPHWTDTVVCRFEDQETRLSLRKTQ